MQDQNRTNQSPAKVDPSRSISSYFKKAIGISFLVVGLQVLSPNCDPSQVNLDQLREFIENTLQHSKIVLVIIEPKGIRRILRSRRRTR